MVVDMISLQMSLPCRLESLRHLHRRLDHSIHQEEDRKEDLLPLLLPCQWCHQQDCRNTLITRVTELHVNHTLPQIGSHIIVTTCIIITGDKTTSEETLPLLRKWGEIPTEVLSMIPCHQQLPPESTIDLHHQRPSVVLHLLQLLLWTHLPWTQSWVRRWDQSSLQRHPFTITD